MMLEQIQKDFLTSLLQDSDVFSAHVKELLTITPTDGIMIYFNSVKSAASRTLGIVYPICQRLLGKDQFNELVGEFAVFYPPQRIEVAFWARHFTNFIAHHTILSSFPYLCNLAGLEWEIYQLLLNMSATSRFELEKLAEVDVALQGRIVFQLSECTVLMETQYPIDEVWRIHESGTQEYEFTDLPSGQFYLIIWQLDFGIFVEPLTHDEWLILKRISEEMCFQELWECLSQSHPTLDVGFILPRLIEQGWIANFRIASD